MEETGRIVDLNGEFRFKIDAKGRMSLPSKFRKAMAADLVVTRNPQDECLYVFEQSEFNAWVVRVLERALGEFDDTDAKHLAVRRKMKSRARDVEVDAGGRIMLAADQRKAVGIDKDVVIVGNMGYFEVWDADSYDEMDAEIDLGSLIHA
jgi:MraZ protein